MFLSQTVSLYQSLRPYRTEWRELFASRNSLLDRIFTCKWPLAERESDPDLRAELSEIVGFLRIEVDTEPSELVQNDSNFGNYLVHPQSGEITGMVDMGSFGLAPLSLVLYQTTENRTVLSETLKYSENIGLSINRAVLFGSAAIHWKWAMHLDLVGLPTAPVAAYKNHLACLKAFRRERARTK